MMGTRKVKICLFDEMLKASARLISYFAQPSQELAEHHQPPPLVSAKAKYSVLCKTRFKLKFFQLLKTTLRTNLTRSARRQQLELRLQAFKEAVHIQAQFV